MIPRTFLKRLAMFLLVFSHYCHLLSHLATGNEDAARSVTVVDDQLMGEILDYMPEAVSKSMKYLRDSLNAEIKHAASMRNSGRSSRSTNSFVFVQLFMGSTPYSKHLSYPSRFQAEVLSDIQQQFGLSRSQLQHLMTFMPSILKRNNHQMEHDDVPQRPKAKQCPYPANVVCLAGDLYRTYDARCNNLKYPLIGASHQPLARFLPPDYADGLRAPRVSVSGHELPSARMVSATVHWDFDLPHHMHTLMLMQFGQFLDHDMSRTAITKLAVDPSGFGEELEEVECGDDGCDTEGMENRACFPILIPLNDTDYGGKKDCLMFVRSQEVPNAFCTPGPREQLNQLTSYLDASHIYGSTRKDSRELRDITQGRGRMRMRKHPAGGHYKLMLPIDTKAKNCKGLNRTIQCFKADYDENVDPSIANSFATAAMRFGHTQIQGMIHGRDTSYAVVNTIELSTQLRRPHLLYEEPGHGMDMMMLGMVGESTQARDPFMTKQVTRHLFTEDPPHGLGEDLMSLNMQRGRDHGIPGYNKFREWCGLRKATSFEDLVELSAEVVARLRILYAYVDDIDLWPAGISENSAYGSLLGPTFTCILSRQFRNLKYGDRFWFENNVHNPYPLTIEQLTEIRKFRYSKIMCTNADAMPDVQTNVFLHPLSHVFEQARLLGTTPNEAEIKLLYSSGPNERVPCHSLPDINLNAWREHFPPPPPPSPPPLPHPNSLPQRPAQHPEEQQELHSSAASPEEEKPLIQSRKKRRRKSRRPDG